MMAPKNKTSPAAAKKKMAEQMAANLANKTTASGTKKVLCLHAGPADSARLMHEQFTREAWQAVWVSANPAFKPDIVSALTKLDKIASGSVDAAWSPHTLKHLYSHEVPVVLKECYRVLKPDGFFGMFTPDLDVVCDAISRKGIEKTVYSTKAGPVTGLDVLYGYGEHLKKGSLDALPKTGFTGGYLGQILRDNGFRDITLNFKQHNIWAVGYKRAADTEKNKTIKITGDEMNARMMKRDQIDRAPEKPVNTKFPFSLK